MDSSPAGVHCGADEKCRAREQQDGEVGPVRGRRPGRVQVGNQVVPRDGQVSDGVRRQQLISSSGAAVEPPERQHREWIQKPANRLHREEATGCAEAPPDGGSEDPQTCPPPRVPRGACAHRGALCPSAAAQVRPDQLPSAGSGGDRPSLVQERQAHHFREQPRERQRDHRLRGHWRAGGQIGPAGGVMRSGRALCRSRRGSYRPTLADPAASLLGHYSPRSGRSWRRTVSPQTLSEDDWRHLAAWAADTVERVLNPIEA